MPDRSEPQGPESAFWLLDGANELTGLKALMWLSRQWPALRGELMATPGYIAHRLWFTWPWTVGLTTWWNSEAAAYRFAHMPQHRRVWAWGAKAGNTYGGWLAHYRYVRGGPLWGNGVRAMSRQFAGHVPEPTGTPARPVPPHGPRPT